MQISVEVNPNISFSKKSSLVILSIQIKLLTSFRQNVFGIKLDYILIKMLFFNVQVNIQDS